MTRSPLAIRGFRILDLNSFKRARRGKCLTLIFDGCGILLVSIGFTMWLIAYAEVGSSVGRIL